MVSKNKISVEVYPEPSSSPTLIAYYENYTIYAQSEKGKFILKLTPTTKEIYFVSPELVSNKLFGTYSSSLSENVTYFFDSNREKVAYIKTVIH